MKSKLLMGVLSILAAIPGGLAQSPAVGARSGVFTMELPAPGTGDQLMRKMATEQSFTYISSGFRFDGAVVENAPYSAEAVTEITQRLADGNRISHKTTAAMYRDSAGRTRREETLGLIGPWASNSEPVQTVFINDPVSKTHMVLDSRARTARKMSAPEFSLPGGLHFSGPAGAIGVTGSMVQAVDAGHSIVIARNSTTLGAAATIEMNTKNESLGTRMIEGVRADGMRTTITTPAGAIGNDLPIETVSERWYSPELQAVVMTRRNDPRTGETVYRLINVSRSEPPQSLFEAPADYTVVEDKGKFINPIEKRKD